MGDYLGARVVARSRTARGRITLGVVCPDVPECGPLPVSWGTETESVPRRRLPPVPLTPRPPGAILERWPDRGAAQPSTAEVGRAGTIT
jgi:hypothetical protein